MEQLRPRGCLTARCFSIQTQPSKDWTGTHILEIRDRSLTIGRSGRTLARVPAARAGISPTRSSGGIDDPSYLGRGDAPGSGHDGPTRQGLAPQRRRHLLCHALLLEPALAPGFMPSLRSHHQLRRRLQLGRGPSRLSAQLFPGLATCRREDQGLSLRAHGAAGHAVGSLRRPGPVQGLPLLGLTV